MLNFSFFFRCCRAYFLSSQKQRFSVDSNKIVVEAQSLVSSEGSVEKTERFTNKSNKKEMELKEEKKL